MATAGPFIVRIIADAFSLGRELSNLRVKAEDVARPDQMYGVLGPPVRDRASAWPLLAWAAALLLAGAILGVAFDRAASASSPTTIPIEAERVARAAKASARGWTEPMGAPVGADVAGGGVSVASVPEVQSVASTAAPNPSSAVASWYGPGFYGNRTACGQLMTPELVGVAHRTLPCGTFVALAFEGRILFTHVVDRGPYVAGRTWDLTAAARDYLACRDLCPVRWWLP